jgi:hypothetical protein
MEHGSHTRYQIVLCAINTSRKVFKVIGDRIHRYLVPKAKVIIVVTAVRIELLINY